METGVQESGKYLKELDSGFRRNDGKTKIQTFYEIINIYSAILNLLFTAANFYLLMAMALSIFASATFKL